MKYATWKWMLCVHCISLLHNVCTMEKIDDPCQNNDDGGDDGDDKTKVNEQLNERASERAQDRE